MNTFSKLYLALHRLVSVGICPDDSARGAAHRQMVSCEFLGHEQLVARDARAAGHHQPFQADAPGERSRSTNFIPRASTNATSRSRPTRKKFRCAIFSSGSTGCTNSPSGSPSTASIRSEDRAEKMRAMDARTLRRHGRPRRDFSGDAQFAHRAQGARLSRRPSASRPRRARIEKT